MRLFLLLIAINTNLLIAYGQKSDTLKSKKWAIGISASPDLCYRIPYGYYKYHPGSGVSENYKQGFCGGISLQYNFAKKFGAEVSLFYSTKGEKYHYDSFVWDTPPYGTVYRTPERIVTITYKYIEIPIKINYYILNKRLKIFPSLGISTNLFIGKKTHTTYFYETTTTTETSKKYSINNIPVVEMAACGGLGLSYDITKKFCIKLEPNYRCFIRPLQDSPVYGYLYSIGCNVGFYYRF